ncbi:rab-like protein 2A [Bolinopsis microptera]|uniref:rab-like protein 2A n=1 Tax=Bolinopsis microptera TaxID=2820187 RepID=UPI00307A343F
MAANEKVKVICLGDSAVGKSKLVERYLKDNYKPQQLSTYALTLFKHTDTVDDREVDLELWDTAGQERFQSMHSAYYHGAQACILVFDVSRKVTYRNLTNWYKELRKYRPKIPVICVANKIDKDPDMAGKSFKFATTNNIEMFFASAADGSNVVKIFREAIRVALHYKENTEEYEDHVLEELRLNSPDENDFDYDPDAQES